MKVELSSILKSILLGAAATAGVFVVNTSRQARANEEWALRLGRQVLEQAEAFHMAEKAEGREQALSYVVRNLTQGVDPRVVRVSSLKSRNPAQRGAGGSWVEVSKAFSASGDGVRVQVDPPRSLFLGARTQLEQDFTLLAVFSIFASWVYFFLQSRRNGRLSTAGSDHPMTSDLGHSATVDASDPTAAQKTGSHSEKSEPVLQIQPTWNEPPQPVTRALPVEELSRSKVLLREVGLRFKETFEQARLIATAAVRSHRKVDSLRKGLQDGVNCLHSTALHVDSVLQQLKKLDENPAELSVERQRELLKASQNLLHESAQALLTVQISLEPCTADADEAFHAFADVQKAAAAMDSQLPQAKEILVEQAKILQKLSQAS